ISKELYQHLLEKNPDIPHYPVNESEVKIPAGWLIEHAGLKGFRKGDAGVHIKQALVLVNYGNASGKELIDMAYFVQQTVFEKFKSTYGTNSTLYFSRFIYYSACLLFRHFCRICIWQTT